VRVTGVAVPVSARVAVARVVPGRVVVARVIPVTRGVIVRGGHGSMLRVRRSYRLSQSCYKLSISAMLQEVTNACACKRATRDTALPRAVAHV